MIQAMPTWWERAVDAAVDMLCESDPTPFEFMGDLELVEEYIFTNFTAHEMTPRQAALQAIAALPPR